MSHDFQPDLDLIASIPAVPSILDVVCQMTGMGCGVVARVTADRWVACSTRDEAGFGLVPGSELKIDTTFCREIRLRKEPVIIEHAAEDAAYCDHPSPVMYGFQSYASFPIVLPDGTVYGTLCVIDPNPRTLKTPQIINSFKLFAELIAYHLDSALKVAAMQRLLDDQRDWQRSQRVLQRELSHRMKNTLAMVQAVVTQSLRNADSLDDAARRATERIQALGRAQDMLTETNWETAQVADVVSAAIAPHHDGGHRFTVAGPPVALTAQQAMGLALAIHELATNATKYGALSNEHGHVFIAWEDGADRFRFTWRESGGPPVVAPERQGFGSRLTARVVPTYFSGTANLAYPVEGIEYSLEGSV
ncbi:HWE histidine kinase domain-containing protein [Aureimonas sp. SK2]|uniref:HWE histidine kinase domain-containing protein n=1 Tax=Aureimonas sp. SK2 TaxID=3015992 RepID=UPI00244477FC|nr:HWE histidine kinase domain-containing protein [Aureimonas sp. SK2]